MAKEWIEEHEEIMAQGYARWIQNGEMTINDVEQGLGELKERITEQQGDTDYSVSDRMCRNAMEKALYDVAYRPQWEQEHSLKSVE